LNKLYNAFIVCLLVLLADQTFAQQFGADNIAQRELSNIAVRANDEYLINHARALALARTNGWLISRVKRNGGEIVLQGVNSLGFPVYSITHNNTTAAATTGTSAVQPGGAAGLNLSGSSVFLNNKLAMWDGGAVFGTHQEFLGKTITIKDGATTADHATHVAGTILAKGVYAPAKGMAFNAATLSSYDFSNDVTEMSNAASGLLLSNHSYGDVAGWNYNETADRWEWSGLPGDSVDYNFGFYNSRVRAWDQIAYNAPYYLIVESAGNSRNDRGPAVGSTYYGYASRTSASFVNKGARPAGISDNGGYDIISTTGTAKNILTVGAISPLPYGPANSSQILVSNYSSWGPTDDGRIKPDIVGDGNNILSTSSTATTAYSALSGTSFSAPNVTGSLYLLQEYYAQKNAGNFMRAATLKGLACHTAVDAGRVGPDYIYGWGLLNMVKATQAITDNTTKSLIKENTLTQGQTQTFTVTASGSGPLAITISWTDLQSTATAEGIVNSRTPKLVNDLDLRIADGSTNYRPWLLDPANPAFDATTGDNIRDNMEQVFIANAVPGKTYTVTISHKGALQSGSQAYSIIATGVGGTAYCISAPLSKAGSRINNISLSNLNNTPAAGCTDYSDYTGLTVQLEQGKTYPLSITLGTCGGNFNKAAKIYIDWNGNGVFDIDEVAATTSIINGTGTFTANITVPVGVVANNFSLMRVVLTETNDATTIQACGNYAKGETQDYRVQFLQSIIDAGVTALINPAVSGTCNGATTITVSLKNFGAQNISNIPLIVTIKAPDNSITTINETYTGTLEPLAEDNYTFTNTFNAAAGATYVITITTNLANDLVNTNNQVIANVTIAIPDVASALAATLCTSSGQYLLSGVGNGQPFWYQRVTDLIPFAYGSSLLTATAPIGGTYYAGLNDFSATVGPATKNVFSGGGYNQFTPAVKVTTAIPVVIQSARLYVGNAGTVTFNVTNINGQVVSSSTLKLTATRSNPLPGAQPDDATDQGRIYNLGLTLPAAGTYTIAVVYDATATLYRNNTGVTGYPFKVGNIFSISGNDATSPTAPTTDTTYYKTFYYYFYGMQVKSLGCASAAKQAVTVSKPAITQNGAVFTSNFTSGNQWYVNGNAISSATGQTYTATQSGNYQLKVTLGNGCVAESDNLVYILPGAGGGANSDIALAAYPSPASSQLNVFFAVKDKNKVSVNLLNSAGTSYYFKQQDAAAGSFNTAINVADKAAGTYILKITIGDKFYSRKVLIVR
jgi:hypothetical protein